MKFSNLILLSGLMCSLCFSVNASADAIKTYVPIQKPPEGTSLVSNTETSLGQLTAVGTIDPMTEWSKDSKMYLTNAAKEYLEAKKYKVTDAQIKDSDNSDALQIIKLNDAVITAITANSLPAYKLPTKTKFDWTIGDGASKIIPSELSGLEQPKYALFIEAVGSYSSDGRKALLVGALLLGSAIPMGGQQVRASLVDL